MAQREEGSHKGFFFLKREGEDRGEGKGECILSCKSKGTIRYIAKRLCSLPTRVINGRRFRALCVPCSANVYVTAYLAMSDYSIVPALCDNGIHDNEMRIERKCALFLALHLTFFFFFSL